MLIFIVCISMGLINMAWSYYLYSRIKSHLYKLEDHLAKVMVIQLRRHVKNLDTSELQEYKSALLQDPTKTPFEAFVKKYLLQELDKRWSEL